MSTKEQNNFRHPSLQAALVAAQSEMGSAIKGSANPFYKSKYADLGAVIEVLKEPLNKHGLALTQGPQIQQTADGAMVNTLQTTLHWEGGDFLTSSIIVPQVNDIQKFGAAITYLRRYALQAFLLIPAEDDDGNSLITDIGEKPPKAATSRFRKG